MSYIQDIDFEFEVGDRFELTPIEGSFLIGKISALGGECYVDGNTIVITAVPGKTAPAPAPEVPAPVEAPEIPAAVEPELSPAEALADVEEAVIESPGLLDAPPVEEVTEAPAAEVEASDEVVETPIAVPAPKATRGRKPAAKPAVEE